MIVSLLEYNYFLNKIKFKIFYNLDKIEYYINNKSLMEKYKTNNNKNVIINDKKEDENKLKFILDNKYMDIFEVKLKYF